MNVIKVKQLEELSDFVNVAEDLELFATNSVDKSERLNLKKLIKYLKDTAEGGALTVEKKEALDALISWKDAITSEDTDQAINKWGEVVKFLEGINSTDLKSLIDTKANTFTVAGNAVTFENNVLTVNHQEIDKDLATYNNSVSKFQSDTQVAAAVTAAITPVSTAVAQAQSDATTAKTKAEEVAATLATLNSTSGTTTQELNTAKEKLAAAEGELTTAKTKVASLEEEVKTLKAALTTFVTKVELYDEEGVVIKPIHLGLSDSDMLLSVPKPAAPASAEVSPAGTPSSEANGSSSEMTPPPARIAEVNNN